MGNDSKKPSESLSIDDSNAWVLTTKRKGDQIAGWVVERLYKDNTRFLQCSERCKLTSYCYPTGSKVVRAKLQKIQESESSAQSNS